MSDGLVQTVGDIRKAQSPARQPGVLSLRKNDFLIPKIILVTFPCWPIFFRNCLAKERGTSNTILSMESGVSGIGNEHPKRSYGVQSKIATLVLLRSNKFIGEHSHALQHVPLQAGMHRNGSTGRLGNSIGGGPVEFRLHENHRWSPRFFRFRLCFGNQLGQLLRLRGFAFEFDGVLAKSEFVAKITVRRMKNKNGPTFERLQFFRQLRPERLDFREESLIVGTKEFGFPGIIVCRTQYLGKHLAGLLLQH